MQFRVKSTGTSGIQTPWETQAEAFEMKVPLAVPPEFGGPGSGLSPEDLYAFALANCFVATFKVIAEKSKLEFSDLSAEGELTLDRNESGVPWMKAFHLKVSLTGAKDPERALRLLEKTSQSCMILNSVKTEKTFEFIFK